MHRAGKVCSTVTDPDSNQATHEFTYIIQSPYETTTKYYNGAATGTPLKTVVTTYTAGTVTTYEPGKTIVVKSDQGPVSFALGTAARVVNGAGHVVKSALRPGQRVRVYYTGTGDTRAVEHVVVEE